MALTLIKTTTVGAGGAASIDITNIPQGFTDLVILVSARSSTSQEHLLISLNGSTANFTGRYLNGGNGSVGSGLYGRYLGNQAQSTYLTNTFGNASIYISNYSNPNIFKSISSDTATATNASTAYQVIASNIWASNAAITSISFSNEGGTNFVQGSTASIYGVSSSIGPTRATGGAITSSGGYIYHTFTASGTFTPVSAINNAEILIIGGGGNGGGGTGQANGGGGAGGVVYSGIQQLSASPLTITVGAGGGNSSSVTGFTTALGGGRGQYYDINSGALTPTAGGASGASGGGGNGRTGGSYPGGTGTAGQGYDGGSGGFSSNSYFIGGGGGGAAGVGARSDGGLATSAYSAWANATGTGVSGAYAGGGAGAHDAAASGTANGGGGGAGGGVGNNGSNGVANTGSGGGGSTTGTGEFAGGSGVVIVRYAK